MKRALITSCLSRSALTNTAIAWASVIGAVGTLLLVPGPTTRGLFTPAWIAVCLCSQVALAAVMLAGRTLWPSPSPAIVFATLSLGGALRGFVIAVGSGLLEVQPLTAQLLLERCFNSGVITVIGVGLIGGTIAWRNDYAQEYSMLLARALYLERAQAAGRTLDPTVLKAWTTVKRTLDEALLTALEYLTTKGTPTALTSAADTIEQAVADEFRPATRAIWTAHQVEPRPLRTRQLLAEVMRSWRLPLSEILISLGIIVGIGSLVRSGFVAGGLYTLRFACITGVILWASSWCAKRFPRFVTLIAVSTLMVLPIALLLGDRYVGGGLLHLPDDTVGHLVVAVATPVAAVFITMIAYATRDRNRVLALLQRRIDADASVLMRQDAHQLSLFMHHSIQSELAAIVLQLNEATATNDEETMESVRWRVSARLENLTAIDATSPPWIRGGTSRERIITLIQAWQGIVSIDMSLPPIDACREDQWLVAEHVIEEGISNSARHGRATSISIDAGVHNDVLVLSIVDDGTPPANSEAPGIGMQWLDRITPREWSFCRLESGSELRVNIR